MRKSSPTLGVLYFLIALVFAGCSSSSKPVSVSLSPGAAQTIDQGQSVSITATLTNDSASKGVTWSLSGSGTLANETATSVTYDAPASVSSSVSATVTATSVASSKATAEVVITVNPAPQVTTTSLPAASE